MQNPEFTWDEYFSTFNIDQCNKYYTQAFIAGKFNMEQTCNTKITI